MRILEHSKSNNALSWFSFKVVELGPVKIKTKKYKWRLFVCLFVPFSGGVDAQNAEQPGVKKERRWCVHRENLVVSGTYQGEASKGRAEASRVEPRRRRPGRKRWGCEGGWLKVGQWQAILKNRK